MGQLKKAGIRRADEIKLLLNINFTEVDNSTLATQKNIPFSRKYTWKYLGVEVHDMCILLSNVSEKKIVNNS